MPAAGPNGIFQVSHPQVLKVYRQQPNYLIEDQENGSSRCVVYFSGNGLYYPSTL